VPQDANSEVRAAVPDLPFVLLDRYEVTDEIGRGGHAIVLRARDRILDRMVAVKVLRDDVFSPELLTRFRQEVQVTAQLEHSNILHVYDTGEFEGRPYLVMELATGETLSARLDREGQLPIEDALRIADEVGMALAHAHARGVIHRDVKPDNILLGDEGAVLADFGIARVTAEHLTNSITSTGTVVGTVLYMSPEQLCADPRIDARSDQYALACVVYEMLAGVRPHVAATFEGLRMLRVKGQHLPVSAHRPAVSPAVDQAIQRAMASMPADRFRGVNEFLDALRTGSGAESTRSVASVSSSAVRPGAPASSIWSGRTRRALLAIVGLGVVAIAGYQLTRSDGGARPAIPMSGDWDVVVQPVAIDPPNTGLIQSGADTLLQHALQADLDLWTGIKLIRPPASPAAAALRMETRVTPKGDSARIQITLTDARGDTTGTVSLMAAAAALQAPADLAGRLVRRALVAHASPVSTPVGIADLDGFPARSLPALLAYARGFAALAHGALDSAEQRFSETVRLVPSYAEATYWQAQTGSWRAAANRALWRPAIDQAVATGGLRGIASMNALALQHLSRAEYPAACRVYRAAVAIAPRNFVSWYGLGECQRLDPLIERREGRLVFRSSHWSALDAYQHAIETAPTSAWLAALYTPIAALSYTEAGMTREGFTVSAPRTPWYALPSLLDDTIGFVPLSQAEFLGMGRRSVPATLPAALRRGRMMADELTARWLRTFPDAADGLY
jgi:tRNA A-37 threonylcarbamoyl transferase component Bud32/tetratricopeptide (TPR) repeat protein